MNNILWHNRKICDRHSENCAIKSIMSTLTTPLAPRGPLASAPSLWRAATTFRRRGGGNPFVEWKGRRRLDTTERGAPGGGRRQQKKPSIPTVLVIRARVVPRHIGAPEGRGRRLRWRLRPGQMPFRLRAWGAAGAAGRVRVSSVGDRPPPRGSCPCSCGKGRVEKPGRECAAVSYHGGAVVETPAQPIPPRDRHRTSHPGGGAGRRSADGRRRRRRRPGHTEEEGAGHEAPAPRGTPAVRHRGGAGSGLLGDAPWTGFPLRSALGAGSWCKQAAWRGGGGGGGAPAGAALGGGATGGRARGRTSGRAGGSCGRERERVTGGNHLGRW